jgi:hypothetical protein
MNARHAYHIAFSFAGYNQDPIMTMPSSHTKTTSLNNGELGSRNVESVDVGGETAESLL